MLKQVLLTPERLGISDNTAQLSYTAFIRMPHTHIHRQISKNNNFIVSV